MTALPAIQPFDLLAFRGHGAVSLAVAAGTALREGSSAGTALREGSSAGSAGSASGPLPSASPGPVFTHVGMAVTADALPGAGLAPGEVYLFESKAKTGPRRARDAVTGADVMGVSLRRLADVLRETPSDAFWCPLVANPWAEPAARPALAASFGEFFARYHGASYEMDPISMAAAFVPAARPLREARDAAWNAAWAGVESCLKGNSREFPAETFEALAPSAAAARGTFRGNPADWQFCSELVARCWQALGIAGPGVDPRDVLPADFLGVAALVGAPVPLPTGGSGGLAALVY